MYWFDDTGGGQCRVPQSWRLNARRGTPGRRSSRTACPSRRIASAGSPFHLSSARPCGSRCNCSPASPADPRMAGAAVRYVRHLPLGFARTRYLPAESVRVARSAAETACQAERFHHGGRPWKRRPGRSRIGRRTHLPRPGPVACGSGMAARSRSRPCHTRKSDGLTREREESAIGSKSAGRGCLQSADVADAVVSVQLPRVVNDSPDRA